MQLRGKDVRRDAKKEPNIYSKKEVQGTNLTKALKDRSLVQDFC